MASTKQTLRHFSSNLDESMGVRHFDSQPILSPVPSNKDVGRMPLRNVGQVDIDMVIPDPHQPRQQFTDEAIERLTRSIQEKGQLSAIHVRWSSEVDKWVIIAGERRWRATKQAGLPTIDCYFNEDELTESDILEQQLIENCLREDLQPIEEAKAFTTLMQLNGWTGKQMANVLHLPASRISRALALLRLPGGIQDDVASGKIPVRSAYELTKLQNADSQRKLAKRAASGHLTHEQVARTVRQRRGKKGNRAGKKLTFSAENGWKVVVSATRTGTYYDVEQAILTALEEVRLRIANNVQLF